MSHISIFRHDWIEREYAAPKRRADPFAIVVAVVLGVALLVAARWAPAPQEAFEVAAIVVSGP